ncbi:Structural maintenance of chromosome 1 protein, putative isoform 1 [Hibiscus syriacus]|uniref:Structural maintenance of chromosome 1 protein, putative isoform 1 n=1 Tax=Hibiscus syriacus TaxID=106335 RepID=A0A6A2ZLL2_HIBSY|nr:Structural maintenance of chromosome 1 protein, putative isoform 1 [Hibiscus syriacus]
MGPEVGDFTYSYGSLSAEEKKEVFEVTRNSLEDELTESMLEKWKQSQPVIQMIIESTTDDDGVLFEALNLHDELQRVISKFEEQSASPSTNEEPKVRASPTIHKETVMSVAETVDGNERAVTIKHD